MSLLYKIAGIAVLIGLATWYVSSLRSEIKFLEQQLSVCGSQRDVLSQKIIDQNNSIDKAKAESDKQMAISKAEAELAKAETKKAKSLAIAAYKARPSTPNDLCKSALDLINGVSK